MSHLSDRRAARLFRQLMHLLEKKHYARRANASAQELAAIMGCDHRALGAAVRRHTGENYQQLLSRLRVAEFVRLLADEDNDALSLSELCLLSGFSSRQPFYTAFKRCYGCEPGRYRKMCREQAARATPLEEKVED